MRRLSGLLLMATGVLDLLYVLGFHSRQLVAIARDGYILLEAADSHLAGYLAVVAEPLANGRTRFHSITIVKYHRWTRSLYFNVIRPFHHLVVRSMVNAGARGRRAERSHRTP